MNIGATDGFFGTVVSMCPSRFANRLRHGGLAPQERPCEGHVAIESMERSMERVWWVPFKPGVDQYSPKAPSFDHG